MPDRHACAGLGASLTRLCAVSWTTLVAAIAHTASTPVIQQQMAGHCTPWSASSSAAPLCSHRAGSHPAQQAEQLRVKPWDARANLPVLGPRVGYAGQSANKARSTSNAARTTSNHSLGLGAVVLDEQVLELGEQDALLAGNPLLKLRRQLQEQVGGSRGSRSARSCQPALHCTALY